MLLFSTGYNFSWVFGCHLRDTGDYTLSKMGSRSCTKMYTAQKACEHEYLKYEAQYIAQRSSNR